MRWVAVRIILFILIDAQENFLDVKTNRVVKFREGTASFPIHPQGVSESLCYYAFSKSAVKHIGCKISLGAGENNLSIDSLNNVLLQHC